MHTKTWICCLLLALAGCDDANPRDAPAPGQTGNFEDDLPDSAKASRGKTAGYAPESSATDNSNLSGSAHDDAARAIVEADVVQVDGDRLYALSRVAGLTVVNTADPAHLSVLGRYRALNGQPFEMYLRDGVVLAMYSSWGQYVKSGDSYQYVQTSKVIALDVKAPSAIGVIGSFDIAGDVSDSRIVGDVLYVVGYQNGYCWGCGQNQPRTSVQSLNVADPRAPRKVDELLFADSNNSYGWNKRSVTVTAQRMYVAGPEYDNDGITGSSIQVIDISDPSGDLVEGATVEAQGQISSRWQMDEYQGVLRVISQFPSWWQQANLPPRVQTFRVESAQNLVSLGNTALTIPPNETLNAVRFDGTRGYAITSQRTDPLFTIDLSDPANPKQKGEVALPGWIYHLEPRGERLIGLGYDQGNPAGGLSVSLFDVSDLSAPKLLDRVNFGGSWAYLPEDQDRIHKAFKVLDDQKLVLVPFSGWSSAPRDTGCPYYNYYGSYRSGVQLVDLQGDDLVLRGVAPSRGEARRAIVKNSTLLTVSDEGVDSYDMSNRDQPSALGRLQIASYVTQSLELANGNVARVTQDWYGKESSVVEIVALADVERPEANLATLDLSEQISDHSQCGAQGYIGNVFTQGNLLLLDYQRWNYAGDGSQNVRGLVAVDASDPSHPKVVANFSEVVPTSGDAWYDYSNYYSYGYVPGGRSVALVDHALVYLQQRSIYSNDNNSSSYDSRLRVIDLTDLAHPVGATLALPSNTAYSGLVADGANVLLSHFEESAAGKARFYIERIDLSVPRQPSVASKINVPGALLHYDRAHSRALTSTLRRVVVDNLTSDECYARFAFADFDYPQTYPYDENVRRTCTGYTQSLHMVRIDGDEATLEGTYALAERERTSSTSMDDGRVAAILSKGYQSYAAVDCFGPCGSYGADEPVELLSLGGFESGTLVSGRLGVSGTPNPWWGWWGAPPIYVSGTRALVQGTTDAEIVDLSNAAAPSLVRNVPLYAYAQNLSGSGNVVLLSLGENGVQRVDL